LREEIEMRSGLIWEMKEIAIEAGLSFVAGDVQGYQDRRDQAKALAAAESLGERESSLLRMAWKHHFSSVLPGNVAPVSGGSGQEVAPQVEPEVTTTPGPEELEECQRCYGKGIYFGRGYVENGVFKGYQGQCFRCQGTGKCTRVQNEMGARGQVEYAMKGF
jgi:DnaJ-class molecular chaperone